MNVLSRMQGGTTVSATSGGNLSAFEEQQEPEILTGTGEEIATSAIAEAETYPSNIYVDPNLTAEWQGINNAVPRSGADVVMFQNGDYSDNANWFNLNTLTNVRPTAGDKALIARGVTVKYDVTAGYDETWIRCDGIWDMDDTIDPEVTAETVYFSHTATLNIGSADTPWPENRTILWEPHPTGDMNPMGDMMLLRRGFIGFGANIQIHCPEKVNLAKLAWTHNLGENQITLDRAVTGVSGMRDWQIGDRLEVAGTRAPWFRNGYTRDSFPGWGIDTVYIQAIDDSTPDAPLITLTAALQHDHPTHTLNAAGNAPVMNMTRNMLFAPPNRETTETWRRPHFLVKTDAECTISGIEFVGCGRTNHEESKGSLTEEGYGWADYFHNEVGKIEPWKGPVFMASVFLDVENIVTSFVPYDNIELVGQTSGARGQLGSWKDNGDGSGTLLLHSRNGIAFEDGEQIVQESGKGEATVKGNQTSAAMSSARTIFTGRYGGPHLHRAGFSSLETPKITVKGCTVRNINGWGYVHHDSHADFLRNNAAWFFSAAFAAEGGGGLGEWNDNCAFGQIKVGPLMNSTRVKNGGTKFGGYGVAFWLNPRLVKLNRNIAGNVLLCYHWNSRSNFGTAPHTAALDEPRIAYGWAANPDKTLRQDFAPIQGFNDCEAFCAQFGLSISKGQANQGHNFRSMFRRAIFWEINVGFNVDYTAHYTFLDCEVYGFHTPRNYPGNSEQAFFFNRNGADMVVSGGIIDSFRNAVGVTTGSGFSTSERRGHKIVDPVMRNIFLYPYTNQIEEITLPWSQLGRYSDLEFISSDRLIDGSAGSAIWEPDENESVWDGRNDYALLGTITDSIGPHDRTHGVIEPKAVAADPSLNAYVQTQADVEGLGQKTVSHGIITLLDSDQLRSSIAQRGVWRSAAGDWVHLLEDFWMDTTTGEPTYFYHPVVIRCTTSIFNTLGVGGDRPPVNNGALGVHNGQNFTDWDPAGQNGLI